MFTGIVEERGELKTISRIRNVVLLGIKAKKTLEDTKIGDSICVSGVCLTVVKIEEGCLFFEAIPETLKVTTLGLLKIGDKVNLERSLKLGDRISGHFVCGHIDYMGIIRKKVYLEGNLCLEIVSPAGFFEYILPKGSIAIDGISLTVVNKKSNTFTVYIIPHTLKNTSLEFKGPSDKVNIEFDILAKRACSGSKSLRTN